MTPPPPVIEDCATQSMSEGSTSAIRSASSSERSGGPQNIFLRFRRSSLMAAQHAAVLDQGGARVDPVVQPQNQHAFPDASSGFSPMAVWLMP